MTVLGRGDLAPPRRPRRRSPLVAALLVLVVLALLAAGGYFAWRHWNGGSAPASAPRRTCVTPTAPPSPAPAAAVTVAVLNSTKRDGLAHGLANALKARGFRVGTVGNTAPAVAGPAVVRFGPGQQPVALAVAEQVQGATLQPVPAAGVTLVLGQQFTALAPLPAAAAARTHDLAAASPRPAVCTSP